MQGKVLCLDWDRRSVRLVVARVGRGAIALQDAHSHFVPQGVDVDDPQAMGSLIAQLIKQHQLSTRRAVVDVSRERAVINRLTVPPTPNDELAAIVQFQALRELPFPADDAVLDFVVTERNAENLATEVMLAAVRREELDRLRATCQAAGVTPIRIGLRPYANLVSARHVEEITDEQHVLLVDVGPAMTEIDVIHGRRLAFSRAANVYVPTRAVERPPEEDESATSYEVEGVDTPDYDAGRDAAVRDLEVEILRTMQAYRAAEPDATISGILIAGGTGIEPDLKQRVEQQFESRCLLYDPSYALGIDHEEGHKLRSFSAALGLAWGLSREGLLELDFLNPKRSIPRGEIVKQRLRIAGVVLGAAAVAAAALIYYDFRQLNATDEALAAQIADLREEDLRRKFVKIQVERTDQMPDPVWLDDLLNITEALTAPESDDGEPLPAGKFVIVEKLTCNADSGTIVLRVLARRVEDLARFEEAIGAYDMNGAPMYAMREYGWRGVDEGEFKVQTTLEIERTDLRDAQADIMSAEKKRRSDIRAYKKMTEDR